MGNKSISHQQIPDGIILNLCDEKGQQLYSPYDTNGNAIKTRCTVTIGEENVLPLPADYINSNEYIDFEVGTYYWQLKYFGNEYWQSYSIPFVIEIRDFELFEVLTPAIFPNEDLQIKIMTPVGTYGDVSYITFLDTYSIGTSYDNNTGILTVSNNSLAAADLTVGSHTKTFNQTKNYVINYEIINPIDFYCTHTGTYTKNGFSIGAEINQNCAMFFATPFSTDMNITCNNQNISSSDTQMVHRRRNMKGFDGTLFPPGHYYCVVNGVLDDNKTYTCADTLEVSTDDCALDLTIQGQPLLSETNPTVTLVSNYLYNSATTIPNARIGLINTNTNTIVSTQTTDTNGVTTWTVSAEGNYKVVALDYDNTWLLSSSTLNIRNDNNEDYVEDININNNANLLVTINTTETPENENLVNAISINNDGNLVLNIGTGSANSIKDIYMNNDDLEYE